GDAKLPCGVADRCAGFCRDRVAAAHGPATAAVGGARRARTGPAAPRAWCRAALIGHDDPRGERLLERGKGREGPIASALCLTNLTRASVLPFVRARYGAQARGCTSQSRQKAR